MTREADQLRKEYHETSQKIEIATGLRLTTPWGKQTYHALTYKARELVSRSILTGDYRSFISLVSELAILFGTIKQPEAAEALQHLVQELASRFKKFDEL